MIFRSRQASILICGLIIAVAALTAQSRVFAQSGRVTTKQVTTPVAAPIKEPPKKDLYLQLDHHYQDPSDDLFRSFGSIGTFESGIYPSGPTIGASPVTVSGILLNSRVKL